MSGGVMSGGVMSGGVMSGGGSGVTGGALGAAGRASAGDGGSDRGGALTGGAASLSGGSSGAGARGGSAASGGAGAVSGAASSGAGGVSGGAISAMGGSANQGGSAGDASGGKSSVFPASVSKPKIMIVGDSISAGPGCYKKYLDQNLKDHQITNYEFVGQYSDDCGGGVRHSAVSCATAAQFTQATFMMPNCSVGMTFPGMSTLVATHDPDLIMVQLGVNDIWSGNTPVQAVLDNYTKLVQQARAHNPNIVMVVAQIHKIITDNCQNSASTANAEALVKAVPDWARQLSTRASPVLTADLWTNSDPHEAMDCVHPNDAGAQRMGLNWFNALAGILK